MEHKCQFPDGIVIKPDGKNELDPCVYETVSVLRNVTVEILKCKRCGHMEIAWRRQEDTEEVDEVD